MRRIRIGNDINLKVSVTRNGKKEDFTGKTVSVFLNGPTRSFPISSFNINGNEITFSFLGSMQKDCGDYTVTVKQEWEDNQNISDTFVAFKLVERSYMAGGTDKYDVYVETIDTETNISTGEGTDDYQFLSGKPKINNVVLVGNKTLHEIGAQPEGNYALKEEIPDISGLVEKEKGKSLSSNDFTKELKQKLEDIKSGADKLGDLSNVGDWANIAPTKDRILVQLKGDVTWRSITLDSLTQTIGDVVAIKIVRSDDDVEGTDNDVFSSLRTLKEIVERSLSRKNADQAAEIIDFLKGLTINGDKAIIDKDGTATVQQLIALVKAQVAALEVTGNTKTNSLNVTNTAKAKDLEVSDSITTLNAVIQALAKTHDLTVENTADIMNGIIRQYLSSDSFVSGFLGSGFKIWKDDNGLWHGELDELTVRKTFLVFELVVQKVVHQGGMVIRSAAGGKLKKVTDGGTYWKCEHDSTDDFVVGDQVLCQTFTGTSMKRYWRLVTSAGAGYFNLSKSDCEASSANPEVGDEVAVLGNRTVTARQKAQIDCAVGDDAPYRDDYLGINSYSLVGKLINRTGNLSGITDPDFGALSGSGFYGINVYLKGIFRLLSGKTVETAISDAQAESNAYTDGKITKIETSFEIREGQISSKVTEATTAAKNADSSATLAQGYASTAGQKASAAAGSASDAANILTTVTQKETSINQTAQAIELKASRAESAAGRAESAEASINLKADGIVLQASSQAAKTAVDGVQVGGRNLALNSDIYINNNEYNIRDYLLSQDLIAGEIYTATIWGSLYSSKSHFGMWMGGGYTGISGLSKIKDGVYQATFTMPNSVEGNGYKNVINIYTVPYNIVGISTIYKFKLEQGNKATDWTPAPEDVAQDATNKANTAESNAKSYANNTFTTKTEFSSQLTILNNSISAKVSQTDFNSLSTRVSSAEAKMTPDAINLTVRSQITTAVDAVQVGGRNLILGSKGHFTGSGYRTVVWLNLSTPLVAGKTYIFSISYSSDTVINVSYSVTASVNNWSDRQLFLPNTPFQALYSTSMAIIVYAELGSGNFDAYDLKLELGNKATDWTPAPEDVDASIALRPTTEEIKSQFTIDSSGISMMGKKIALTGLITFSSLASDAQNKITTAQSTADTANSTAGSALASAGTANSGLTTLKNSLGSLAYANTVSLAKLDTTIIEGGYIKTSLINANAIITNDLLATKIAATDITTGRLTVTDGAKIGGWIVEGNALKINSAAGAKILVEPSGTRFLRINDSADALMAVRADGVTGISIYTQDTTGKCLRMTAQTGGTAIESYGGCTFTARTGELIDLVGQTRVSCFSGVRRYIYNANSTINNNDFIVLCNNSSSINPLLLPASPVNGQIHIIIQLGEKVTLSGNGNKLFNGSDKDWIDINSTGEMDIVIFTGNKWCINYFIH